MKRKARKTVDYTAARGAGNIPAEAGDANRIAEPPQAGTDREVDYQEVSDWWESERKRKKKEQ